MRAIAVAVMMAAGANGALAGEWYFPADSGVVNVTEHGVTPDDGQDDTAALQAIISKTMDTQSRYATPKFIYLPRGVYDISDTLEARVGKTGWSSGWRAGFMIVGQSREGTILRLKDSADGFGDAKQPKSMVITGSEADKANESGGGNRAFRHNIMNLTLDVGQGNAGAVGIDYCVSNRGVIRDVTIKSPGAGHAGILLTRAWPGPALIKNVSIEGFDYGVRASHYQYGMTFEHIELKGQKVAGIENVQNMLAIRGLRSDNKVVAINATSEHGLITLVDSQLGGGGDGPAIQNKGRLLLSNVTFSGYDSAVKNEAGTKQDLKSAKRVEQWASHAPVTLGKANGDLLGLKVEESPEFDAPPAEWVSVTAFGATVGGEDDDTEAIQKAIDSGKQVVYLPNGSYRVTKPLIIRGNVRKIVGFQSAIGPGKDQKLDPLIRFEGSGGDGVILEHLWLRGGFLEHASAKSVTIRHVDHDGYRNTKEGTGKFFVEDAIGKPYRVLYPQSFWGRQVNCEFGEAPLIENHGGRMWILGYKTEGEMVCVKAVGGQTEIIGGLFYPLKKVPDGSALFDLSQGARLAASYVENNGKYPYPTPAIVREGDDAQKVDRKQIPGRGTPLLVVGGK